MKPTCANIRNEFRLLYNAGCDEMDKLLIKEFFNLNFDQELSDVAVKKCNPDKFKALCNFLQRDVKTHERNIELLAWLINFPRRPFSRYWRVKTGKPDLLSEISINESGIVTESNCEPTYKKAEQTAQKRASAIGHIMLQQVLGFDHDVEIEGFEITTKPSPRFVQKEVTLEYPSGVKLSVDASDLGLIAKLIKL